MKRTMSIISLATTLLLTVAACSDVTSIDDTPKPATPGEEIDPTAEVATVITTTATGTQALSYAKSQIATGTNMAPTTILLLHLLPKLIP